MHLIYYTCTHHACRYTEWVNRPDDGIDIAKALLAAAKANHVKIVDIILRKDNQDDSEMSVLRVEINGLYTWKIAVLEELSCIFEVCHIQLKYNCIHHCMILHTIM